MGVYKPLLVVGNFVYVSGHGPVLNDGTRIIGRIGEDMDIETNDSARYCPRVRVWEWV